MNTATASTPALSDLVKVGDFFVWSWGYDQANIDYFQVVSMTKASVKVREVHVVEEDVRFALPQELARMAPSSCRVRWHTAPLRCSILVLRPASEVQETVRETVRVRVLVPQQLAMTHALAAQWVR